MTQHFPNRGYCPAQNRYVYGYLYDATPSYCFSGDIERMGRQLLILVPGFADWGLPRPVEQYLVDPDTVGSYTGLCVELANQTVPVYTGMRMDVQDEYGLRTGLTVSGPVDGCFVYGGDRYPTMPLKKSLEVKRVYDPKGGHS